MRVRDMSKAMTALFAALCFAVLAGLHLSRPVSLEPDPILLGFTAEDICGSVEDEHACPHCLLVNAATPPVWDIPACAFEAKSLGTVIPPSQVVIIRHSIAPYTARSPPLGT